MIFTDWGPPSWSSPVRPIFTGTCYGLDVFLRATGTNADDDGLVYMWEYKVFAGIGNSTTTGSIQYANEITAKIVVERVAKAMSMAIEIERRQ